MLILSLMSTLTLTLTIALTLTLTQGTLIGNVAGLRLQCLRDAGNGTVPKYSRNYHHVTSIALSFSSSL